MGVTGLWKLIEPCGKPVPVETLEGKVLAVDISIWLHQVVKGFQDNKGAALSNAHLLGLFNRLCKLMYYRVKPVFVFDGCVPQLKRDTIARRQQQRSKLNNEADRIQALLLQSLAKEKIVQQALGPNVQLLLTSPGKKAAANNDKSADDMFKLPELPEKSKNDGKEMDDDNDSSFDSSLEYSTASTDDSSFDENNPRVSYNTNLQAIDVRSKHFLNLPADVRHEILVDIKETRKQSSWGRLHELPSRSDDFSTFQMKRLLKRRDVQVSLEEAEKEMGGRTLTFAELTNIFTEEGIIEPSVMESGSKQILSDEHTRFLLVRDLKKKIATIKEEIETKQQETKEEENTITSSNDDLPSTSKPNADNNNLQEKKSAANEEYENDLELAIALSLQEGAEEGVYREKDYELAESLRLSKSQKNNLQNAAKGPARSYMIEYGGMNEEEVVGILEKTQANFDDTLDIERLLGDEEAHTKETGKPSETKSTITPATKNVESQELRLCVTDDSDDTDSDLEEVVDNSCATETPTKLNIVTGNSDDTDSDLEEVGDNSCATETPTKLNIVVDINKPIEPDDDMFADIFKESEEIVTKIQSEDFIVEETPPFLENSENKIIETSTHKQKQEDEKNKTLKFCVPDLSLVNIRKPAADVRSILDELKQQAEEIKNIKLENIKLSNSIIEISDDEQQPAMATAQLQPPINKMEIIEICDSDDNKRSSSPPISSVANSSVNLKSPNLKTPSKNKSITEFFDVNYVVKRTPDKPLEELEEKEVTPKVKSPFFVKKTPKSAGKSGSKSPSPNKRQSKASKTLFLQQNEVEDATNLNDGIEALPKQTTDELLNDAAELLKNHKSKDELSTMATELAKERRELETERNRQDRMGMSITQRMNSDCQELLKLFGVPFIVAPMEAEAQCAFLDIVQLTNGTITDDSDIWLFGGRTVYKNFFAQNKHVLEFQAEQIEKNFSCDRRKLIQLACLVGSDYTSGIHGIGAITALEILASFSKPDEKMTTTSIEKANVQQIMDGLQRFHQWWQTYKSVVAPPGSSARLSLMKKLKNIEINEGFPSIAVVEAYLTPKVDENKDAFSWGYPDVESLREFAKKSFGWTTSKTNDILMPVIKKLNEKRTQQSIRNYFNVKNTINIRQLKVSKRVQNAIDKMSGNVDDSVAGATPENKPVRGKRAKKTTAAAAKKKKTEANEMDNADEIQEPSLIVTSSLFPDNPAGPCSSSQAKGPAAIRVPKRVNIPNPKQTIPQREKTLEEMKLKKQQAAEVLKQSSKVAKKKRK